MNQRCESRFRDHERAEIRRRLELIIERFEKGNYLSFANKIATSSGNVDAWHNPKKDTVPSVKCLYDIAATYNISLDWLVLGKGEMLLSQRPENPEKPKYPKSYYLK